MFAGTLLVENLRLAFVNQHVMFARLGGLGAVLAVAMLAVGRSLGLECNATLLVAHSCFGQMVNVSSVVLVVRLAAWWWKKKKVKVRGSQGQLYTITLVDRASLPSKNAVGTGAMKGTLCQLESALPTAPGQDATPTAIP